MNTTAGSASKDMGPPGRPSLIDRGASNGDMQNANPSQYRMDAKDNIVQLDESPDQDGAQQPDSLHRRTSQNRDNQRMSDMDDDDMDRSENSEGNIEPESESDQDETAADKYELRYPYSRLQEAQVLLQLRILSIELLLDFLQCLPFLLELLFPYVFLVLRPFDILLVFFLHFSSNVFELLFVHLGLLLKVVLHVFDLPLQELD